MLGWLTCICVYRKVIFIAGICASFRLHIHHLWACITNSYRLLLFCRISWLFFFSLFFYWFHWNRIFKIDWNKVFLCTLTIFGLHERWLLVLICINNDDDDDDFFGSQSLNENLLLFDGFFLYYFLSSHLWSPLEHRSRRLFNRLIVFLTPYQFGATHFNW